MRALRSTNTMDAFRQIFVSMILVNAVSCTTVEDIAAECKGERVSLVTNDFEHVTCWINYGESNAFRQGPYRLIVDGTLEVSGYYENDRIAGIWHKYDDMGNIVSTCDFSTEANCEL